MDAIDTSLLFALFNAADRWHGEAKAAIQKSRPIVVPPGVLQETLDLVALRQGPAAAMEALAWLAKQDSLVLDAPRAGESHASAVKARGDAAFRKLSFADIWCVAHARLHGAGLLSRDADQMKAFVAWKA